MFLATIAGKLRSILGRSSAQDAFEQNYQAEVDEAIAKGFPVPPRARELPFSRRKPVRETGPSYEESYQAKVDEAIARGHPIPPRARDLPSTF
ncbi:MAG: hypothetical protein P4L53_06390 [Candidatus Obscuribacterales bacterium]|nr:hypothetical protein [Candidatus Obscuribacterales bacterium]